jgi:hypothetical protein
MQSVVPTYPEADNDHYLYYILPTYAKHFHNETNEGNNLYD